MPLLYAITFASGAAALVYEILWIRELRLVLGSTTASISTVVAAFMAGLALGSVVIGRRVDRARRPLLWYAALEAGIVVSALAVLVLVPGLDRLYPALASATGESGMALALARFVLVFGLLLVPTSLMGGTYPVLVKAMARDAAAFGGTAGRLYAANTAGAVAGCLLTGVVLLGALGTYGCYAVAIVLNLVAGAAAWALGRGAVAARVAAPGAATAPSERAAPAAARRAVAWTIGLSGAMALGYEIVWSRALAKVLGHSIYAFTLVLAVYLAGIAAGGALAAPWLDRLRRPASAFAWGLLALGVTAGASLHLVPLLPFREYVLGMEPYGYLLDNLLGAGVILLLPTLLLGALLPLAVKICAPDLARAGRDVGRIYGWNTVGSIAGSLAAGFVLVPRFGSQASIALLATINLGLVIWVGWAAGWRIVRLGVTCAALVAVAASLRSGLGSPILRDKALARVEEQIGGPLRLLYFGEDDVTAVGLVEEPNGVRRLAADGVIMTHWTLETIFMAHLPLAAARAPSRVLVLCLGMGNTFAAAVRHPVRVEAVELSPKVVEAFRVLHGGAPPGGANGTITVGDARNAVYLAREPVDVITVDPPPPLFAAGTAYFHTREFLALCRRAIRPGGVVSLWIPFGQCTLDEFKSLLKTFRAVFPRMSVWTPTPWGPLSGVYVLGLGPEAEGDPAVLSRRLLTTLVAGDAQRFSDAPLEALLPQVLFVDAEVDAFCGDAPILSDDHPILEFPLFRNAGNEAWMHFGPIREWLAARGRTVPGS
jgi:spermidine synthase